MKNKTRFISFFLVAFTLMLISSGLSAGTFGLDGKKKDKRKGERYRLRHFAAGQSCTKMNYLSYYNE